MDFMNLQTEAPVPLSTADLVSLRPAALDQPGASAYSAMSRSMLYEFVREGRIRPVRYGRKVVFLVEDLDRLIAELKAAS